MNSFGEDSRDSIFDENESQEFLKNLQLFVAENSEYYMRKWYIMVTMRRIWGWNWCAFLFPWAWLAYRKMYMLSVLYIGLIALTDYIFPNLYTIIWFVSAIALAIFANYIYYVRASKKVMSLLIMIPDENLRLAEIFRRGGTSWWSVIIIFLLFVAVFVYILPVSQSPMENYELDYKNI